MYPIRGDRYKCVECKEDVGFDLCIKCHESRESHSKLGRFNQQHNSSHTLEVLKPRAARNIMFTLLSLPILPDEEIGDKDSEDEESRDEDSEDEE